MVIFENIHKSFGDRVIYQDLNLVVKKQSCLAIVGFSGIGKSVLLKHIVGLIKPDIGKVLVDGSPVHRLYGKSLSLVRQSCSMVFQGGALFDSLTVGENVSFVLIETKKYSKAKCRDIAREQLNLVGLEKYIDSYPSSLSGGMCKRVAIARALVSSPKLILYDEPTAGLDPVTASQINDLMVTLHEKMNITSIVVTHDKENVRKVCNEVALLYNGKILVHEPVMSIDNRQESYLKSFWEGSLSKNLKIG